MIYAVVAVVVILLILLWVFHRRIAALETSLVSKVEHGQWLSSAQTIRNDFNALASRVSTAEQKLALTK